MDSMPTALVGGLGQGAYCVTALYAPVTCIKYIVSLQCIIHKTQAGASTARYLGPCRLSVDFSAIFKYVNKADLLIAQTGPNLRAVIFPSRIRIRKYSA